MRASFQAAFRRASRAAPPLHRRHLHTSRPAMAKPKVLLCGNIIHAQKYWDQHITPIADTIKLDSADRADFLAKASSGAYDGAVAAYRTFDSVAQTGFWDHELCRALPASLHFVAHNGAGYDQLRAAALTDRSIVATNVPTAVDDATADTAVFLLLGALRNFNTSLAALRRGLWRGTPAPALGHDPQGKTLGILGMGGIGRNLAHKARALGMKIAYHNRRRLSADQEAGAAYLGFDELLAASDVLSVHVPLSEATRHLLGAKELAKCKPGVVIVNTARGAVIDEAALVDALRSGHVASAGLDVYEEEPKVHPGLVSNDNVLLLPHMGTWTKETQEYMEQWCIDNVVCGVKGAAEWSKMSVIPEQKEMLQQWIQKGSVPPASSS